MSQLTREQAIRLNEYVQATLASAQRIVDHLEERGIPQAMREEFMSLYGRIEQTKLELGFAWLENDYSEIIGKTLEITALYVQMSDLWKRIGVYEVVDVEIPSGREMEEYVQNLIRDIGRKAKEGASTLVKVVGGGLALLILYNVTKK